MTKRIFIWVAHPKSGSLCEAMGTAYEVGAKRAGAQVQRMNLSEMQFDLGIDGYDTDLPLEPDLTAWQEHITWADHLMFIHPYWWGAMPTKAKAVLDRALTPGFGYKYRKKGMAWDKLLAGRTADTVITSDTPPLIDTLIYRRPARRVMRNQVLRFCGIKPRKIVQFGSVKLADQRKIDDWIGKVENMGLSAAA